MSDLDGVGFALTVPASWYELDLRPTIREPSIRALVETRVREVPQLREHRPVIVKLLREVAERAWDSGARYAAGLVEPTENGPLTASTTVTVLPMPPREGELELDVMPALLKRLTVRPLPAGADRTDHIWTEVDTLDLPDAGPAARAFGVEDVHAPDGIGVVRVVIMQTFIPVPGRDAVMLVSCSSPVLPLADSWFDLFDAISSTFRLVETSSPRPS